MPTLVKAQERPKSPEELELEKQFNLTKLKKDIALAELEAAKAKADAAKVGTVTDKEQAELDKAIAEANKATFQAKKDMYSSPEVETFKGKVTSDGTFIETKVMAQKSLLMAMNTLCTQLNSSQIFKSADKETEIENTFVIYNAADFIGIELYSAMIEQVKSLEKTLEKRNEYAEKISRNDVPTTLGSPLLIAYAASGILRTAADIVSLFKTNSDFKNIDMTVDETAIVSAFRMKMSKNWKVYVPSMYPVKLIEKTATESKFIAAMNEVQKEFNTAEKRITALEAKIKVVTPMFEAEKDPKKKEVLKSHLDDLNSNITELKNLRATYTQLQTTLSTVDQATKMTAQSVIMRAEKTHTLFSQKNVYVIKFLVTSKGSTQIKSNIWRNDKILHSAGTEISCLVFDSEGVVIFSHTLYSFSPYVKAKDVE